MAVSKEKDNPIERLAKNYESVANSLRDAERYLMSISCPKTENEKCDAPDEVLNSGDYTLAFVENFTQPSIDLAKWNTSLLWSSEAIALGAPHLTINGEEQFYVDVSTGEDALYGNPFDTSSGNLIITASSQTGLPQTNNGVLGGQPIRSGVLTTFDSLSFTYGYVEICAKLPVTCGSWPAFWLLHRDYSFDNIAEIDFMELPIACDGNDRIAANAYQTAYHYTDQFGTKWDIDGWQVRKDGVFDGRFFGMCNDVDPTLFAPNNLDVLNTGSNAIGQIKKVDATAWGTGFHTYGVHWCPGEIIYYVDGVAVASVCEGTAGQTVYDDEMYLIINYAVGGAFPGDPVDSNNFNDQLEIEYVKIWTKN